MTATVSPMITAAHEAAVERTVAAMQSGLFEQTSLDVITSCSLYSRFHFHRMFRTVTGTTPGRFLAILRMQRAKELLAETSLPVAAVGGLVGYDSLGTFTSQFGRLVGVSPGRFRRLVDLCDGRRLDDVEWPGPPSDGRPTRALRLTVDGSELRRRTTVVGLFDSGVPTGLPARFAAIVGGGGRLPAPELGGTRSALAISVPSDIRVIDVALGRFDDTLVSRSFVPETADAAFEIALRRPRAVDPPMLTVAPVRHLLRCR